MAWTYKQLFNLLNTAALNGQDSWIATAGFIIQETTKFEGAKAVRMLANGVAQKATRIFTGIATGSFYVAVRKSSNSLDTTRVVIADGVVDAVSIRFTSAGKIEYYESGYTEYGSYSADQWYVLNIEFDQAVQGDKYRFRLHNGTFWSVFTSWIDYGSNWSEIDRIYFAKSTGNDSYVYYDTITPTNPISESLIKSINGLSIASVKSKNGLAIADVKSINGLA